MRKKKTKTTENTQRDGEKTKLEKTKKTAGKTDNGKKVQKAFLTCL